MGSRRHLVAVNRAIRAADLDEQGLDAPIVELVRDLARQMDSLGPDGPSSRLLAAYLSATKDLTRATTRRRAVKPAEKPAQGSSEAAVSPPSLSIVEENPLDRIRRAAGRAS